MSSAKNITIGYVKLKKEGFISTMINNKNFLGGLSKFVKVVKVLTDSRKYDIGKLRQFNIDYLVVDTMSFRVNPFILREKNNTDIPFIIVLRTIEPWFVSWLHTIPLIKERDIVIAPSEYAKNSFLKISKGIKVHVIPNCIDVRNIQNRLSRHKIEKTKRTISFMGRLSKEKGIETVIECMPEIISKVGDLHLNIIGPLSGTGMANYPKAPYVKKLERKIRKLRLSNNVTFKGLKLGFDKYKILSESDLFMLPTTDKAETFGISALEALACGVPVVASNLECIKSLVKDGENGYLAPVNYDKEGNAWVDRKKLINLAVKILWDEKLASRMQQKAREIALNYDFHKVIPEVLKLLERKKEIKTPNNDRWEMLKNKRAIDFKNLYNKDMQFFINFDTRARRTYFSIYNEMKKNRPRAGKKEGDVNRKIKNTYPKLVKKIQSEFAKYLCIR